MTTEIKILRENDVSVSNQILNLNGGNGNCRLKLSAASFVASAEPYESLRIIFDFIHQCVVRNMPGYAVWFLLSNSAWQPGTKIVKYLGLWGGLKSRGIEVPRGIHSIMHTVEHDGKLKFFGGVRLSDLSDGTILEAILSERCSYVAIVPIDLDMEKALFIGWSGMLSEDLVLCEYVAEGNGLLMAKFGEFDDLDNGVVGVGGRQVLDNLLLALND
ncbi:hypothetical protein HU755_03075 [Pseudomonas sp. SWRI111]|uniref:hypothetical protein n=1 Tax=Pseudomonas sp. SWRI111 TaxID=2745507 RepID=UPI0016441A32|nr:hypothetical protein [Pseudomonas sp. SWRI111]MBC3205753.1 hypothetical protein [Pseudomonas sp. SWRI111]